MIKTIAGEFYFYRYESGNVRFLECVRHGYNFYKGGIYICDDIGKLDNTSEDCSAMSIDPEYRRKMTHDEILWYKHCYLIEKYIPFKDWLFENYPEEYTIE